MPQMPQPPPKSCGIPSDILVERLARETLKMPNQVAWAKILEKLREVGCGRRRANQLRPQVWLIRRLKLGEEGVSETRETP